MKFYRALCIASFISLIFLSAQPEEYAFYDQWDKQKGMSYAAWWPGLYSHPDSDISLSNLAENGTNWISLIVTCYQENIASTEISASEGTPTDEDLIHVIIQARALGLKVMLKPHVDFWRDPAHWRGQIGTSFTTEAEWSAWFSSYQDFIRHYAELAQSHGADQFCVGTELLGTSHRASEWRRIVEEVRSIYSGPLVYAANHSGEETSLTWWDALDYIGVDAYYPLTGKTDPTLEELEEAWKTHLRTFSRLVSVWQKPILLTEIGYRSLDGATSHPWDWQISGTIDLQEQADAYQAVFESFFNQPWLAGIFWWSWGPDPLEGGPQDDGYTPHGKPAEDVLRKWYEGPERPAFLLEIEPDHRKTLTIYSEGLAEGWEGRSSNAELDLQATDQARSGKYSISARLGAWGNLSFWHLPFSTFSYHWLVFHIRSSAQGELQLQACFHDREGTILHQVPINDVRYLDRGTLKPGSWIFVSIPLWDMKASRQSVSGLTIQDRSGHPSAQFWIDDIRLVGGRRIISPPPKDKKRTIRGG